MTKQVLCCSSMALVDDNLDDLCSSHTPAPVGYLAWHNWAETMNKTHKQVRCMGCGLFKIWIKRKGK